MVPPSKIPKKRRERQGKNGRTTLLNGPTTTETALSEMADRGMAPPTSKGEIRPNGTRYGVPGEAHGRLPARPPGGAARPLFFKKSPTHH